MSLRATLFSLGVALLLFAVGAASLVMVPAQSEAVITRNGEILRVAGPGLQYRLPGLEQVTLYETLIERQTVLEADMRLVRCPAAVAVVTRIGDVAEFHQAGAEFALPSDAAGAVRTALARIGGGVDDPHGAAEEAVEGALSHVMPRGLLLVRVSVDTGDCGIPPPAPQVEWLTPTTLPTIGVPGAERSLPIFERLRLGDNSQIEVDGAVATWDITDPGRMEQCFGRADRIGARVSALVGYALRARGATLAVEDIAELPEGLIAEIRAAAPDLEENCGLRLGAVDFDGAEVTGMLVAE